MNEHVKRIKAITLWQPWSTLIMLGIKKNETRHWPTKHRGELLIHAAKRELCSAGLKLIKDLRQAGFSLPEQFPTGALGVVNLIDCIKTEEIESDPNRHYDRLCGNYEHGRFAWKLELQRVFEAPVSMKGRQGIWNAHVSDLW